MYQFNNKHCPRSHTSGRKAILGFNLIEMMIVLFISAILIGIGLPQMSDMLDRRAVTSEADRLIRSLQLARSTAITDGGQRPVAVASKSGNARDWTEGWRVYIDTDNNQQFIEAVGDDADEELQNIVVSRPQLTINTNGTASTQIFFDQHGRLDQSVHLGGLRPIIAVCDAEENEGFDGTLITVELTGRISITAIPGANKSAQCTP